jgi:hypothetical protein
MTTTYNYIFNNLSRIGDDNCGITARDTQNNIPFTMRNETTN